MQKRPRKGSASSSSLSIKKTSSSVTATASATPPTKAPSTSAKTKATTTKATLSSSSSSPAMLSSLSSLVYGSGSGTAATATASAGGGTVHWKSVDPRSSKVVAYTGEQSAAIEKAYQSGQKTLSIKLGTTMFTIEFASMTQKNNSGGSRKIIRDAPHAEANAAYLDDKAVKIVLEQAAVMDKHTADIEANCSDRRYRCNFKGIDAKSMLEVMAVIINNFQLKKYRDKYGFQSEADGHVLSMKPGQQVPNYYANVTDQSIFQRKMLSLLGIQNLILHGGEVFFEMKDKLFSSNPNDYANKTGPNKMRYFTGNAVDLDTNVLLASSNEVLKVINNRNKTTRDYGGKQYKSTKEFGTSDQAKVIAVTAAKDLIENFVNEFKLSAKETQDRHLVHTEDEESTEIPTASGHTDRGRWPLWFYNNVGVMSYHANVPNMPDVYGALLKAPFHLCKCFALIHARYPDPTSREFQAAMDDFYEEAVADTCFNAKWKSIELFCSTVEHVGTIDNVLNDLQMKYQKIFTNDFFDKDPDRTKEASEMLRLATETKLKGRDEKINEVRLIEKRDVDKWIQDTN